MNKAIYACLILSLITSSYSKILSIQNNPFRYSGEYDDTESALQYLNARYYAPATLRFISLDTYDLLNRYGYTEGNPIMYEDPSGHSKKFSLKEMQEKMRKLLGSDDNNSNLKVDADRTKATQTSQGRTVLVNHENDRTIILPQMDPNSAKLSVADINLSQTQLMEQLVKLQQDPEENAELIENTKRALGKLTLLKQSKTESHENFLPVPTKQLSQAIEIDPEVEKTLQGMVNKITEQAEKEAEEDEIARIQQATIILNFGDGFSPIPEASAVASALSTTAHARNQGSLLESLLKGEEFE